MPPGVLLSVPIFSTEVSHADITGLLILGLWTLRVHGRGVSLTAAPTTGPTRGHPHPCAGGAWGDPRADGELNSDRGDTDVSRWADLDARSAPGRRLGGSLTTHRRKARRTDEARPGHLRRMTHERLI